MCKRWLLLFARLAWIESFPYGMLKKKRDLCATKGHSLNKKQGVAFFAALCFFVGIGAYGISILSERAGELGELYELRAVAVFIRAARRLGALNRACEARAVPVF